MKKNTDIKKATVSYQERVSNLQERIRIIQQKRILFLKQRIKLIHRAKMSRFEPMPVTSTLNRFAHGFEVDPINLDKIEAYLEAIGDFTTDFHEAYKTALSKRGLD